MKKEETEEDFKPPEIITKLLNKAEHFIHKEKFIKSFFFGMLAIIIGLIIASFLSFRNQIIGIFISISMFTILYYWII